METFSLKPSGSLDVSMEDAILSETAGSHSVSSGSALGSDSDSELYDASSFRGRRKNQTKLDVMNEDELSALHNRQIFIAVIMLLAVIIEIILVRVFFSERIERLNNYLFFFNSPYQFYVYSIVILGLFAVSLLLFGTYSLRVLRVSAAQRTHEQLWGLVRNAALMLYINPIPNLIYVIRYLKQMGEINPDLITSNQVLALTNSLKSSMFVAGMYMYFWSSAHSYRILRGPLPNTFYVPKVLLLLLYIFAKQLMFWQLNVSSTEIPFVSLAYYIYLGVVLGEWPLRVSISVSMLTIIELILVSFILFEVILTFRFYSDLVANPRSHNFLEPEHNSSQRPIASSEWKSRKRSFDFFVRHHVLVYSVFYICYIITLFGLPSGPNLMEAEAFGFWELGLHRTSVLLLGYWIGYSVVESYVNLPSDAEGLKGWFVPRNARV